LAQTRVENILATIREAIDKGPEAPVAQPMNASRAEQGTLMRGALREMRVSFHDTDHRDLQLSELRERIQRQAQETSFTAPPVMPVNPPPLRPTIAEREDGFGGILSGKASIDPVQRAPAYNYQRPRYMPEEDLPPLPQQTEVYAQQTPYEAPYGEGYSDPYTEQVWDEQQYYEAPPPPRHEPARRAPRRPSQALISAHAEQASRASFDELADVIMARAGGDRGIEDLTRDLLRGLLRNWLDEHLPQMVERLVREEIERVARGR
jgi:uncharacterized protein